MKSILPIYLPKHPKKTFKFIKAAIKNEFSINEITEDLMLDFDGLTISFIKTCHPVLTFAIRFKYKKKIFVYTSDTRYFDDLVLFSKNANLLLSEATLQEMDKKLENLGHMTARRSGTLAKNANAQQLVLTHFWPEYIKDISLSEAKEIFDGTISLGGRGKIFLI